jgi:hypothetical protein
MLTTTQEFVSTKFYLNQGAATFADWRFGILAVQQLIIFLAEAQRALRIMNSTSENPQHTCNLCSIFQRICVLAFFAVYRNGFIQE